MKTPTLKPIDLKKRQDCNHPDITCRKNYLTKIEGKFFAGRFSREWYGLNFEGVYDAGYQLSYDGWQGLWEIVK